MWVMQMLGPSTQGDWLKGVEQQAGQVWPTQPALDSVASQPHWELEERRCPYWDSWGIFSLPNTKGLIK